MEVRHVTPSTNQERRLVLFFLLIPSLSLTRSLAHRWKVPFYYYEQLYYMSKCRLKCYAAAEEI